MGILVTYRRKKDKKNKWRIKVKRVEKDYSKQFDRARTDGSRALAAAREMTRNPHINVYRKRVPKKFLKFVEKELGAKFELRPKVYIYGLKKGRKFKKREMGRHLGSSFMPLDASLQDGGFVYKAKDPYILLPRSHLKDPAIYHIVLMHELAESLAMQERYKIPTTHQQALRVERKVEKELGTEREKILRKANKLWNTPEAWK